MHRALSQLEFKFENVIHLFFFEKVLVLFLVPDAPRVKVDVLRRCSPPKIQIVPSATLVLRKNDLDCILLTKKSGQVNFSAIHFAGLDLERRHYSRMLDFGQFDFGQLAEVEIGRSGYWPKSISAEVEINWPNSEKKTGRSRKSFPFGVLT